MKVVLVGAPELLDETLERAGGEDDDVIVVQESAARLEELERAVRDPRVWYLLGSGDVLPLPDGFADELLGTAAPAELARVTR